MKAYHNSVVLRNDGQDPSTLNYDLNAGITKAVTIRVNSTQALAVIYDLSEVATANPLTSDANGNYAFKASDNIYDIIISEGTAEEVKIEKVEVIATSSLINDLSQAYDFPTVAAYKASTIAFPDGKQIKLLDRNAIFTKISGTGTANTFNIIANTTLSASIDLNVGKDIIASQWIDVSSDAEAALPIADALGKHIIIDTDTQVTALGSLSNTVEFTEQGTFSNSATFTFNGSISGNSARSEIFIGTGDIVIKGMARTVYPEWFGIFTEEKGNDGSVNLDSNIRRAGRCIGDSETDLLFGDGKYFVRDFLIDQSNSGIKGAGKDRTFLENSTVNNTSTRFGVQVTIFAPNAVYNPALGNRDWTGTETITDCRIQDLTIIWDDTKTVATDPNMNGLAVLGCQQFLVKNVHFVGATAQRAFAIQTNDQDQKTEDGLLTQCSCTGALTGIYVSEGQEINTGKSLKNINVINNHFSVRLTSSLGGRPSSPIFIHGGEVSGNIDAGIVTFRDNHCEGGAYGAYSSSAGETTRFNSKVVLDNNQFVNFREIGALLYFEDLEVTSNVYDAKSMQTVTIQSAGVVLKTKIASTKVITGATQANPVAITSTAHGFTTGQMVTFDSVAGMTELNGKTYKIANETVNTFELFQADGTGFTAYVSGGNAVYSSGTRRSVVRGNKFKNLSGTGTIRGVTIDALFDMSVLLDDNDFIYDNLLAPQYDVYFNDGTGITCDINLSNNKFFDTTVANVRGTTVNQEMLYNDLGGNSNINWFNREHYNARFTTPVDSRYYSRGVFLTKANPSLAAGTEIGFLCTADHTPTVAGTWKSVIG